MKKTLTVNVSGQVYHIDEDGYEVLQNYLVALENHFKDQEGGGDIIDDIELRISELFGERISVSKQVVTLVDVNEVIEQLGQPFEMDGEHAKGGESPKSAVHEGTKRHRRFYRDSDRKVVGGVCSGIGAYFDIDPVLIRIAFIILFLFAGSSLWIYVILWIAIPEARTTAEKLEMSGESVNVDNIERKIKAEFEGIKSRIGNYTSEAKSAVHNMRSNVRQNKCSADRTTNTFADIVVVLARIIGIVVGAFFVIIGLLVLILLFVYLFSYREPLLFDHIGSVSQLLDLMLISPSTKLTAVIGLLIVLGLPLLMVVYGGVKLILGLNFRVRYLGLSVFFLWLMGAIMLGVVVFEVMVDMRKKSIEVQQIPLIQPMNEQLYVTLELDSVSAVYVGDECQKFFPICEFQVGDSRVYYGVPDIIVRNSTDEKFGVSVKKIVRGDNAMNAKQRSGNLHYSPRQSGDTLFLPSIFSWSNEHFWRFQSVQVTIYCPKDKALFFLPDFAKLACRNFENGYLEGFINKRVGVNDGVLYDLPQVEGLFNVGRKK